VDLCDVRTGKLVRSLEDHPGLVKSLSYSATNSLLAVGCNRWTDDDRHIGEVWLWNPVNGRRRRMIPLGNLYCLHIAMPPSGDLLAVAGNLDLHGVTELRLFDPADGRELARLRLPAVRAIQQLVFRPDGKKLAAIGGTAVRVWSVQRPAAPDGNRDRK
jgi:WD40 repeat protein